MILAESKAWLLVAIESSVHGLEAVQADRVENIREQKRILMILASCAKRNNDDTHRGTDESASGKDPILPIAIRARLCCIFCSIACFLRGKTEGCSKKKQSEENDCFDHYFLTTSSLYFSEVVYPSKLKNW